MVLLLLTLWLHNAAAQETAPPPPETETEEKLKWSGVVLAYPSGSSVDGVGLGVGGQIYARPPSQTEGYRLSILASLYANFRFDYTHDFVRFESNGHVNWLATVGYTGWRNYVYAGVGGENVMLNRPEREGQNVAATPFVQLAFSAPLRAKGWSLTGQSTARYAYTDPNENGLLEAYQPLGIGKSAYADIAFGAAYNNTDQWPLPNKGWQAEASLRAGLTFAQRDVLPMGSAQLQVVRWSPLWRDKLVLGMRFFGEADIGRRPFYEQDRAGLRWRDVLGEEQLFTGYGKNRPRGDSALAAAVELRLQYAHHHGKFWDLQAYLSVFVEEGFLWDAQNPGPHLPSVGVAPVVLFQHAIILRPFLSWGWRADEPGDPRRAIPQFGLSLLDPL